MWKFQEKYYLALFEILGVRSLEKKHLEVRTKSRKPVFEETRCSYVMSSSNDGSLVRRAKETSEEEPLRTNVNRS